jgi:hypothetical protein
MTMTPDLAATTAQTTIERRASNRRRALKGATVRFNKDYDAIECVVRDQSDGGARLVFSTTQGIPNTFGIEISGGESRTGHVRWRNRTDLGITIA